MARTTDWNGSRYMASPRPMYESFFLRANHPKEAKAFWIRYTLLHTQERGSSPVGELWVALFDEGRSVMASREVLPLSSCSFASDKLDVAIGSAVLREGEASGQVPWEDSIVRWDLAWESQSKPLFLLQPRMYEGGFPKAKALVPSPMARFGGTLHMGEDEWSIEEWYGSQNHNWGTQHTDAYAWGQVMGFDTHPQASLECATAKLKIAGLWTPPLTVANLRLGRKEYRFDSLLRAFRSAGSFAPFSWSFSVSNGRDLLEGEFSAAQEAFVALPYGNPSGGTKICLNSKIASVKLRLKPAGGDWVELNTESRGAFELLDDHGAPGVGVDPAHRPQSEPHDIDE